jgi:hypothetical protein
MDELVLRNVRTGEERSYGFGISSSAAEQLSMQAPMPWSPDNSRLAVSAFRGGTADGYHIVVLDEHGSVVDLGNHGQVVGWLDDDTVIAVVATEEGDAVVVSAVRVDGAATVLSTVPGGIGDVGLNHLALSPDGRTLAGIDFGASPAVVTIEVGSGHVRRVPCVCDSYEPTWWVSPTEVYADGDVSEAPSRVLAVDTVTGATRTILSFSPRFDQITDVSFAPSIVAAGPDGSPITSRWWPGWYLDCISYGLAGLALLVAWLWLARARRRPRDPEKPVPPIGG